MKILYLFVLATIITTLIFGQDRNSKTDLRGWEFLEWKSDLDSVKNVLNRKGIEDLKIYPNASVGQRILIQYDDMSVWLTFDSLNQMIRVDQNKGFHVGKAKEAQSYFKSHKKRLQKKFGKRYITIKDKKRETIKLIWNLKYTKVLLYYDYQYKIIDEFGANSYEVEIIYSPS